jgi:hypothetical protein
MLDNDGGIVALPTGTGKTVVGLRFIAAVRCGNPTVRWKSDVGECCLGRVVVVTATATTTATATAVLCPHEG